ncbi:hypothetical protein [uncultured Campylobacter sp.]|mgnify:FL=1|nr:hypothetical protein [uncultured Campylobacter sp.]
MQCIQLPLITLSMQNFGWEIMAIYPKNPFIAAGLGLQFLLPNLRF